MRSLALFSLFGGAAGHRSLRQPSASFDLSSNFVKCLSLNSSSLASNQDGIFASCDIPSGSVLGELAGKIYNAPTAVPNDGDFAWKVPMCDAQAPVVLNRADTMAWQGCTHNGFTYVDSADLDNPEQNPLRFVQKGTNKQTASVNTDLLVTTANAAHGNRVFYYATRKITKGDEVVVGADPQKWAHARQWHAGGNSVSHSSFGRVVHAAPPVKKKQAPIAKVIAKTPTKAMAKEKVMQKTPIKVAAKIPVKVVEKAPVEATDSEVLAVALGGKKAAPGSDVPASKFPSDAAWAKEHIRQPFIKPSGISSAPVFEN